LRMNVEVRAMYILPIDAATVCEDISTQNISSIGARP
jgi:hypothetical protein